MELLADRLLPVPQLEGMEEEGHDHDHEEEADEHVWLSLKNARVACEGLSQALMEADEAKAEYERMLAEAEHRLENKDLYGYFGVGMPSPLPFELNIVRQNTIPALLIKALAEKGLGREEESRKTLEALKALDVYGTPLRFFEMLNIL